MQNDTETPNIRGYFAGYMNIVFKKYVEAAEAMCMSKAGRANSIFKKESEDFMKSTLLNFPTPPPRDYRWNLNSQSSSPFAAHLTSTTMMFLQTIRIESLQ